MFQVLITKLRSANTVETRQYRKASKALLVLIPLLGITYLVVLAGPNEGVGSYIFVVARAFLLSTQVNTYKTQIKMIILNLEITSMQSFIPFSIWIKTICFVRAFFPSSFFRALPFDLIVLCCHSNDWTLWNRLPVLLNGYCSQDETKSSIYFSIVNLFKLMLDIVTAIQYSLARHTHPTKNFQTKLHINSIYILENV